MRKPPTRKASSYLKQDWSAEEKAFKDGIPEFQRSVSPCNTPMDNPCYAYKPEEKIEVQAPAEKGVAKEPEKMCEIKKDERTAPVESANVRIDSATQPTLRRDVKVLEDPLDPFSVPTITAPKNEEKMSDDFFDAEQPKQSAATLSPTKLSSKAVDPFEDFVAPAPKVTPTKQAEPVEAKKPERAVPASVIAVSAALTKLSPAKEDEFPKDSPLHAELTPAEMDGLDVERFNTIRRTVQRMLDGAPNHDLTKLTWNIDDYAVEMDLDPHRENPNILSQKIVEIQAMRDSLWSEALKVSPVYDSFKGAEKYLKEVAIDCSTRSSGERRLAHIKALLAEFYVRLNAIERAKYNVDKALERLGGQYDCISRLVTTLQQKIKIKEISRGAAPWEEAAEIKAPAKPAVTSTEDDDMVNRSMSQPLAVKKFNNMETFDPTNKPAAKKANKSGFTDF